MGRCEFRSAGRSATCACRSSIASFRPLPVGVPGEICVGGVGVGRGYLDAPGRTAEVFVPDPTSREPGDRLYRTGDLGRRRPGGELEFLGRFDGQVKIRGARIELGEIEAALAEHPGVARAILLVRRHPQGDDRLAAYWTWTAVPEEAGSREPAARELRDFLKQRLPEAMIPTVFVRLEAFPTTPSGKLDRRALPEPDWTGVVEEWAPAGQHDEVAELLAGLFAEVLGRERIDVREDFFEAGGHSLLAAQLTARVRRILAVDLPLRSLFEAPTAARLADRVRELASAGAGSLPPIVPMARTGDLPLSFGQERLWFLAELNPGSPAYNMPGMVRLQGSLAIAALAAAFGVVMRRHEVLRTVFAEVEGVAVQRVLTTAPLPLPLPLIDLRGLPVERREAHARRLAAEEARRPFDLTRGQLLVRAALLCLEDREHLLLFTLHHIVSDGWSQTVLIREISELYGRLVQGAAPALPELPIQYADFALWQRQLVQGDRLAEQLAWWRARLGTGSPPLELPLDHPRPPVQLFHGGRRRLALPHHLGVELHRFARRQGGTLFMALLALFEGLLYRLSGQPRFNIGTPVANRRMAETEGLIGFFVNTLVLPADLSGEPSLAHLLERARETALGAFAHQDLPFERLVEDLQPARELARSPLFQAMLILQNAPVQRLRMPDLEVEVVELDNGTAKFELTVSLEETAAGLEGWIEYDTDLFEGATVERLADRFVLLLAAGLAEPERPVAELPLLGPVERHQLLWEWNDARLVLEGGTTLLDPILEWARRTPTAVAVSCAGRDLTYAELVAQARRLASTLQELGVGPEVPVGLCLERSPEMVVGLLGILLAGGAYVPLDPLFPRERLAWALEDAGAAIVLTEAQLVGVLPAISLGERRRTLLLDELDLTGEGATPPASKPQPHGLAYILFTSGSTGRPKGVTVPHGALFNFLAAIDRVLAPRAGEGLLAVTTLSFDIAGLEIFLPLVTGGRVILASREAAADGVQLVAELERSGAVRMQATPATWRLLLEAGWVGAEHLQALCGGEALPRELARELRGRVRAIWNLYGPTETTIWSALARLDAIEGSVPIGRPIGNTVIRLLDRHFAPTPSGVAGEVFIGGAGVARGYAGRPDLTAERFLPDPAGAEVGARLYRTGDLARLLPDGRIEFLGRADQQVKVRGFRIELEEIEAALESQPEIERAVVVVRDVDGDPRLVAFLAGTEIPPPATLRAALARRLPDYMIPSRFVPVDAFPLTPNGKVDRRSLVHAALTTSSGEAGLAADPDQAQDPFQEITAGVFARVLGLEKVGLHDNFFALGGHSLLATRAMSLLREALGVELPLQALFGAPTAAGLARAAEVASRQPSAPPPLLALPRDRPLPASFAQERLWFLDQLEPGNPAYNLAGGVRLAGALDVMALAAGLARVVERHEALRTTFAAVAGRPVQVIGPGCPPGLPLVDLTGLHAAARQSEAGRWMGEEARRPFDLACGPLLRTVLLREREDEHLLLVTLHHIVGDGWSLGVLVRELGELYRARLEGREPTPGELPELAVQYADYAVWQRQWLSGAALADQLAYWRERLAGAPTALELPADRPRGPVQSVRGALLPVALPVGLGENLEALARRAGATPFMVLLAAFDALLLRWSGQQDLLVGSPIAHRTRLETEGLIGFFVNTLVLRAELAGNPSFGELLGQVRSTTLGAYGHQDVPFEKLVEELSPPRDRSRTPLFQVMLALQNVAPLVLELPGLEIEQLMLDSGTAKFDLTLIFTGAGETLSAALEYGLELFDRATMERLARHLLTLLEGVVEDPGRRLSELPLLTREEEEQLRAHQEKARGFRSAPDEAPAGIVVLDLADRDEALPPRTPVEELLAGVFAELLDRPRVGIDEDFFDLGGHSLLATQVMARVRDLFGVELPVALMFAAPTVEGLAREIAAGETGAAAALPPIVPVPRRPGEGMLLSYSQERLWFLDRLDPDSPAYNIPGPVRLRGELDVPAFRESLAILVARHETLRTRFAAGPDGGPVQVIDPPARPLLPVVDLAGLEPDRRAAEAAVQAREEACRPFDLACGPLLRTVLLREQEDEYLLLVTLHHIVGDGWSLGVLVRELGELYRARLEGREPTPSELPELAVQYADYAVWQRRWLSGPALADQLAYWRERLAGAPTALELPADRPRGPVHNARGALLSVPLPVGLGRDLEALARRAGATPFMVLLAAFDALLLRWSGQEDLLVGFPIAHRTRLETEGLIGFFVNTLVLRAELAGDPPFGELLGQVRSTALGAYAHQDLPFEKLVEELSPPRDRGRTPLFQVALALQNVAPLVLELPGLEIEQLMLDSGTAKFDLTLMFNGAGESLSGALEYRLDLFDRATAERLAAHFGVLLEGALVAPERPVAELALLSPGERHQILVEWNPGPTVGIAPETLVGLFARQAALRPDATAVVGAGGVLSYGELARASHRLARRLEARGVGRGSLVGICLERDMALPVALLAVLEAGAAYVPLDPGYPPERLAYMLADSGMKALVTEAAVAAQLPDLPDGVAVVRLDGEQAASSREDALPLPPRATPGDLAYVIYTSGSTGRPKGVAVRHAEVVRLMAATEPWFGFGPGDVWTLFHSYAFDFSVWELWGALAYGGTLVVVPYWTSRSPEEFRRLLERERVTVLNQTPSAFRQLIAAEEAALAKGEGPLALRFVLFGGEALELRSLAPWWDRHPDDRPLLVNLYGITETTVHVTYRPVRRADLAAGKGSVIGGPIPDLSLHLLDRAHQPVPIGVAGELYVGGAGLALGYLGWPDLTAERFLPDAWSGRAGERLYRSGDLARRRPDGDLEYLGRADQQVKVRGFRIELGEIEAVLGSHPGVATAVVVAHTAEQAGELRLAAYLEPDQRHARPVREMLRLEREGRVDGHSRIELPNGLLAFHLNRSETDFLFREIFEQRSYLRHGIQLADGACVFDVGANIGIFGLFLARHWEGIDLYAFEPLPPIFEVLQLNLELHGVEAHVFQHGLASVSGEASFSYFPHASVLSGRFADDGTERETVRSFLLAQLDSAGRSPAEQDLEDLLNERLERRSFACPMKTLSEVFRENGVERIDLLKVDVEKAELDVLQGIADEDWPKVRQVVAEVHDRDGRLREMVELLERQGFEVVSEQDDALLQSDLYNLYAWRSGEGSPQPRPPLAPGWSSRAELLTDVRRLARERLPDFMVPAAWVVLERLPLTPSGKIDRRALPAPEGEVVEEDVRPPQGPVEEILALVWAQVLGLERVGVDQSFFDLGGHSLMAMQLLARVRDAFQVELSVRSLFEAPTVAGFARAIEAACRAGSGRPALPLTARTRRAAEPLSFAQERLWFLDQLAPGSSSYNIPVAVFLLGQLDGEALAASLREIVQRHEALRTTFAEVAGSPVQVIAQEPALDLPVVDLSGLPQEERQERARQLAAAEAVAPFDLEAGPLLRATLLRLGQEEHELLLSMHHIVSDGWSMGVLVSELAALYAAFREGQPSPLPELPIQYADFAIWQREWLAGEVLERQLAWWRERLAGAPTVLDLPMDRPRPPMQTFPGGAVHFALPPETAQGLADLGRQRGTTLFMALLAAFQAQVCRYTGRRDLLVGTPIANRNRLETEGLIGFFVNTLVLRGDLRDLPEPTFGDLLSRVREATLGAYAHQDLPFEKLVEELQPERHLAYSPLFQVTLVLQNAPMGVRELPGLVLEPVEMEGGAKFDLTLAFDETVGSLTYNLDLFDRATAERMAGHFATLLAGAVADPGRPLADLPLLTASERQQLQVEWDRAADVSGDACLHELFEEQVRRTPGADALVAGTARLTYAELDARAEALARYLRALGVGPEERAAVCAERSVELVVALLAVLKAGGAYVPIDPTYPRERQALMLEDSRASVLLTQRRLLEQLPEHEARVALLDEEPPAMTEAPAALRPQPGNLAYFIYTSGSTGRPKGVAIEHRSVVVLARWARQVFTREELSGVLFATAVCFDLSIFELFAPLSWGGKVILAENTLALPSLPAAGEVRLVNTMPSALTELVRSGGLPASVVTVNLAGEALTRSLAEAIYQTGTVARLYNLYGPSEDTTYSTFVLVPPGQERPVTIGRPIANARASVLDAHGRLVPVGVPGELYLGGSGLARGYFDRPELTAERFVPDPFAVEPGARLYRTGDLVRRRPDGELDFLGRIDHQVKVRGFRIEPGEIEAAILGQEGVREAVVLAREDQPGDQRLVAYVAPETVDVAAVRAHLKERLPESMVPALFVLLPALPLSPNGKVDRKALPAPDEAVPGDGHGFEAPRTPTEEILAGIWAEVLGLERVGPNDNFFRLGGHSLLLTQVMSRLRSAFGVEVPLRSLFEAPTLAGFVARIEAALGAGGARLAPLLVPIAPNLRQGPLPLSFAQERVWFVDQLYPGNPLYNIPFALRVEGTLSIEVLALSLEEIVRRHEALRTVFDALEGSPVQVILPEAPLHPSSLDLAGLPEAARQGELRRLLEDEARQPFDLAAGPLLRATLVRLGEIEHVVLFTMHHIISDGWSIEVLVREFAVLYEAFLAGRPSPLPALPLQYADFASWQRSWLQGAVLEGQLSYWRRRLAGAPELDLPTDHPRPDEPSLLGANHRFEVSADLLLRLREIGGSERATLFMTLLTAFYALLQGWTGQDDLVVGTDVANRNRLETESLIGFLVNNLVLRTSLAGQPTFRELLRQVRGTTLEAYTHEDLPFELLVKDLRPKRTLGRTPLFQVLFVLQNTPGEPLELPGLTLSPIEPGQTISKFEPLLVPAGGRRAPDRHLDLQDGALRAGHHRAPGRPVRTPSGRYREAAGCGVADAERQCPK